MWGNGSAQGVCLWYYVIAFTRNKELENDEVEAYCMIARDFIALTANDVNDLLKKSELIEVNCDD